MRPFTLVFWSRILRNRIPCINAKKQDVTRHVRYPCRLTFQLDTVCHTEKSVTTQKQCFVEFTDIQLATIVEIQMFSSKTADDHKTLEDETLHDAMSRTIRLRTEPNVYYA